MTSKELFKKWKEWIILECPCDRNDVDELNQIERDLEILEIIRNKSVDIGHIRLCMNVEDGLCKIYNYSVTNSNDELTEEEYEKIKEWLKDE